jgi:hypothetical protein
MPTSVSNGLTAYAVLHMHLFLFQLYGLIAEAILLSFPMCICLFEADKTLQKSSP